MSSIDSLSASEQLSFDIRHRCEDPEYFRQRARGGMFGGRFLRFENNEETRLRILELEALLLLEEWETVEGCEADMFWTAGGNGVDVDVGGEGTNERLRVRKAMSEITAASSSPLLEFGGRN